MFSIFKGHLLGLLHDRPLLVFFTLFPTLLVFILGTLLGNLDAAERTVEPFELAYVIDSDDPVTTQTAEFIITQFDDVEQLAFTEYDGLASVDEALTSGALGGAVVFTEPFGIEIREGRDPIQNRAIRTIFEGVARLHGATTVVMADVAAELEAAAAVAAARAPGAPDFASALGPDGSTANGMASSPVDPALLPNMPSFDLATLAEEQPRVEEKTYGISRTMLDYYAITMIVMMFFMGSAMSGAAQFYEGRKNGTLRRIFASPQRRVSVYLQMLMSAIPLNLLQVGIVMVASTLFLNVHYAATWQLNLLLFVMLFAAGFATSALFMALGIFVRFNPVVIILPLMWAVLFISGTFSKEIFIPNVTELSPPWRIQSAAFDLTLFGHTEPAIAVLLASLAVIALSTVAGVFLLRRKDVAS